MIKKIEEESNMRSYPKAAGGLKLLFIAEILAIVGAVLSLVPILGPILLIVAQVLVLVGLYQASTDDEGYKTAFIITIVNLVVSVVSIFADGVFASVLGIVDTVLNLAVAYFVINTTVNLAHSMGKDELSAKGQKVWKLYLVCAVASIVIALLSFIPVLAAALGILLVIFNLIAYILYLIFLYQASAALA